MVRLCTNASQVIGSLGVCICVCMCVGVCLRVCGCVSVGYWPSMSGKRCHSYINKPDRRDRLLVGSFSWVKARKRGQSYRVVHQGTHLHIWLYCLVMMVLDGVCAQVCVCRRLVLECQRNIVDVDLACKPAPHVLMRGLWPCFPVNTQFFSSSAEEGRRGLLSHLLLLLFSPIPELSHFCSPPHSLLTPLPLFL